MKVKGLLVLGEYDADPSSPPNGSLWFNLTLDKFRVNENGIIKDMCMPTMKLWDYWSEHMFIYLHTITNFYAGAISSGTVNNSINQVVYRPYGVRLISSVSANSGYRYLTSYNILYFGTYINKFRGSIMPTTSHTNNTIALGYLNVNVNTSESTNGAYFLIVGGTVTPKTAKSGTRSSASTYALTINVAYTFDIEVAADSSNVRFRIYEENTEAAVYDQTITSANIPNTTSHSMCPGIIATNSGTTAVDICNVYKMGFGTLNGYLKS